LADWGGLVVSLSNDPADFLRKIRLNPPYPVCSAVYWRQNENLWKSLWGTLPEQPSHGIVGFTQTRRWGIVVDRC
jgi:hypothetical protein